MKKIYDKITEIKIEGVTKGFVDTSLYHHYHYRDSEEPRFSSTEFSNYDDLFEAVIDHKIPNASVEYTLFTNKPYLKFFNANEICEHYMKQKTFKTVHVVVRYEEVKSYSLKTLYESLPAEEFMEFCADRNQKFYDEIAKRG
jgi:hypothetical protein